jgi:ATPase subunit of ABC transporter with duplicated ATPase domains
MKEAREAMLVITHDRDVLEHVDRIVELKDGSSVSYKGNYDAYLKQNAVSTGTQMNDFELTEKRIANLKVKVLDYQRLKEKSRNPSTIQKFKRLEMTSRQELSKLQEVEKPTFWIDKNSVENLNYKVAAQYDKFKAKNIRMNLKDDQSRSKHVLISARDLSLGYVDPLFKNVNIDLREGESLEIRGRNGAGKTTLIKAILNNSKNSQIITFEGEIKLDHHVRIGVYEQEVSSTYFNLSLESAVEKMYLDKKLPISTTKVRSLLSDYLFTEGDLKTPISVLSGGQKARFQIISMLANDPQLLILDEPTNHLDLPSIEELETALKKYSGAIVYVSHDGYFCDAMGGQILKI